MSDAFIFSSADLSKWVDRLTAVFDVFGPTRKKRDQVVFDRIINAESLALDYCSTMLSPRQFIYPPRQPLFKINRKTGDHQTIVSKQSRYAPGLEGEPPLPQVKKQLMIEVEKVIEFKLGPHSDVENWSGP